MTFLQNTVYGVLAQATAPEGVSRRLYRLLDDEQRMSVVASFAIIATMSAFLILFVVMAGRITRGYVNRQPRVTKLKGDPFERVIDAKPRPRRRESRNWQQR